MPDNFLNYITIGMGNIKSKPKERFGRSKKESSNIYSAGARRSDDSTREHDFSAEIHARFAEDDELKKLRELICNKPDMFILNNLMMCVQFFANYDEEIDNLKHSLVSSRETELNSVLPSQKHALIPDILQQHVSQRFHFTDFTQDERPIIELLHPIRIFVAFENIEVTEDSFVDHYCPLGNAVTYNMQLKPSPSHKGYGLLVRLEVNPARKAVSVDKLDLASMSDGDSSYSSKYNPSGASGLNKSLHDEADSIYDERRYGSQGNLFDYPSTSRSKDDGIYDSSASKSTDPQIGRTKNPNTLYGKSRILRSANGSPAGSTSSGYRSGNWMDSSSDYSYARTTTYNTPKTSKSSMTSGSSISGTEIPRQCFKRIVHERNGRIYEERPERQQKMSSTVELIKKFNMSENYEICYFNSTMFIKYFCRLFVDQLAGPMDFDPYIKKAVIGGVIRRTKLQRLFDKTNRPIGTKVEHFEIVPSVKWDQWPECANEWLDRPRATWPQYNDIEKVRASGCYMIPDGIPSDTSNKFQDLEWQLVFPKAERYLETCLTYPQVRVYLMALMLQKTFLKSVDSIFGLSVTHIKHGLFWLVERDDKPSMWMENRTGESLMKLLWSLYRSISLASPCIPDYFIRTKNLMQEKPYLTQRQLNRIIGNPVMYVFHAMENIKHNSNFFPRLNFEELFRILTGDVVCLANPELAQEVPRQMPRPYNTDDDEAQGESFWSETNQQNCEQQKIYGKREVKKKKLISSQTFDQVKEIQVRCQKLEPRRLSHLLDFFIRHFIKMAEKCHSYRALQQKVAYVDQAERLAVLLSEHPTHIERARTYLEKLCSLRRRAMSSRSSQNTAANTPPRNPPETPKRNADEAIFKVPFMQRYVCTDNHVEQPSFVKIPQTGESKEYGLESAGSSVYNLQVPPTLPDNRPVVTATIHEEDTENLELRNSSSTVGDQVTSSTSNGKARIISISDTKEDSYLTETTYI